MTDAVEAINIDELKARMRAAERAWRSAGDDYQDADKSCEWPQHRFEEKAGKYMENLFRYGPDDQYLPGYLRDVESAYDDLVKAKNTATERREEMNAKYDVFAAAREAFVAAGGDLEEGLIGY